MSGTVPKRGCFQVQTTSSTRCVSWKERPTFCSLVIHFLHIFFPLAILENFSFVSFWSLFLRIPFLCSEQSDTLNGLEREGSLWSAQSHSCRHEVTPPPGCLPASPGGRARPAPQAPGGQRTACNPGSTTLPLRCRSPWVPTLSRCTSSFS